MVSLSAQFHHPSRYSQYGQNIPSFNFSWDLRHAVIILKSIKCPFFGIFQVMSNKKQPSFFWGKRGISHFEVPIFGMKHVTSCGSIWDAWVRSSLSCRSPAMELPTVGTWVHSWWGRPRKACCTRLRENFGKRRLKGVLGVLVYQLIWWYLRGEGVYYPVHIGS